jgi:hypothetical protein
MGTGMALGGMGSASIELLEATEGNHENLQWVGVQGEVRYDSLQCTKILITYNNTPVSLCRCWLASSGVSTSGILVISSDRLILLWCRSSSKSKWRVLICMDL